MKLLAFISIYLVFLGTGCSHYYASQSDLNQRIDKWLVNHEYAKIENAVAHLSGNHPDYNRIKARSSDIDKNKQSFINNTLVTAQKMQSQNNWQQAIDTLDEALRKIPEDTKLLTQHKSIIEQRNNQVIELRKDMLLKRSRALIQYKAIYKQLEKLIPEDFSAQYDINNYNKEKTEISAELMDCGNHALAEKQYAQAEECFHLSHELIPSKDKLALLNKTKNRRKIIEDKNRSKELIESYQKAFDKGDFPKARYHLETLIALKPDDQKARQLKARLDKEIHELMTRGIAEGKKHYSEGNIKKAVTIWQELLKTDPKNTELISLLARGKKVSKKIENLEKSSTN
ncbi:MAG: hypothetical protein OQL06_06940 [Gammaproteobacteria bacterium]|nr:hypothetical protein [Gammaproteobacteria bacterium]